MKHLRRALLTCLACTAPQPPEKLETSLLTVALVLAAAAHERPPPKYSALETAYPLREQLRLMAAALDPTLRDAAARYVRTHGENPVSLSQRVLNARRFAPSFTGPWTGQDELAVLLHRTYVAGIKLDGWAATQRGWAAQRFSAAQAAHVHGRIAAYWQPLARLKYPAQLLANPWMDGMTGAVAFNGDVPVLLLGPTTREADFAVLAVHESIHLPVEEVLAERAVKNAMRGLQVACERHSTVDPTRWGYDTWHIFVAENVVRALSYAITQEPFQDSGMVLDRAIYTSLATRADTASNITPFIVEGLQQAQVHCG